MMKEWWESWFCKDEHGLYGRVMHDLWQMPDEWVNADDVILFRKFEDGVEWTIGMQSWTLLERGGGRPTMSPVGLNPIKKALLKRAVRKWKANR